MMGEYVLSKKSLYSSIDFRSKKYREVILATPLASVLEQREEKAEVLSTGLPAFDWGVIGIGGFPFSRAVEIFGKEGSGKTRLAMRVVAKFHEVFDKEEVLWVDAEGSHVASWMKRCGIDLGRLRLACDLGYGEAYIDRVFAALALGVRLVVVDAVPSLLPKDISELDKSDLSMHEKLQQASLITNFLTALEVGNEKSGRLPLSASNCLVIFINHTKAFQTTQSFYEDSKGAQKLKHICRLRLNVKRASLGDEVESEDRRGRFKPATGVVAARVLAVKNQHAPGLGSSVVYMDLNSGEMWDDPSCTFDLGVQRGVLRVDGTWIKFRGMKWQGKGAFFESLRANPDLGWAICSPVGEVGSEYKGEEEQVVLNQEV